MTSKTEEYAGTEVPIQTKKLISHKEYLVILDKDDDYKYNEFVISEFTQCQNHPSLKGTVVYADLISYLLFSYFFKYSYVVN